MPNFGKTRRARAGVLGIRWPESGAEREIIIARNGKPAAKLVGIESGSGGKRLGVARGKFKVPKSIDEHDDEVAKLFGSI